MSLRSLPRFVLALVGPLALLVAGCDTPGLPEPSSMLGEVDTDELGSSSGEAGASANDHDANDDGTPPSDAGGPPVADDDGGDDAADDNANDDAADDDMADGDTDAGDDGDTGESEDDGGSTDACATTPLNLVPMGSVNASSEYDGWFTDYPAALAVDGDLGSSWFSAGPQADGMASTFEFAIPQDHCIDTIEIVGNGSHLDTGFRVGFGYEWVSVEVIDATNTTVFVEEYSMQGSPDPTVTVDVGGLLGRRIVLHLTGHESQECGGFGELYVSGRTRL